MFLRSKRVRGHRYLMLVENYRVDGRVRQRVLQSFGRQDRVQLHEVRQALSKMPGLAFLRILDEMASVAPRGATTGAAQNGNRITPLAE